MPLVPNHSDRVGGEGWPERRPIPIEYKVSESKKKGREKTELA